MHCANVLFHHAVFSTISVAPRTKRVINNCHIAKYVPTITPISHPNIMAITTINTEWNNHEYIMIYPHKKTTTVKTRVVGVLEKSYKAMTRRYSGCPCYISNAPRRFFRGYNDAVAPLHQITMHIAASALYGFSTPREPNSHRIRCELYHCGTEKSKRIYSGLFLACIWILLSV